MKLKPWLIVLGIVALFAMIDKTATAAVPSTGQEEVIKTQISGHTTVAIEEEATQVAQPSATVGIFHQSITNLKIAASNADGAIRNHHFRRTS